MTSSKLAPLLGGAVIVAMIGCVSGYFGAMLAQPALETPAVAGDANGLSGVRKDVEELDRRLEDMQSRLTVVEDTANAALDRSQDIDRLLQRVQALEGDGGVPSPVVKDPSGAGDGGGQASVGPGDPVAGTGAERDALDEARRLEMIKKSREIFTSNARKFLPFELNTLANATEDGAAQRRSNVYSRSRQLAVQYRLPRDAELRVRKLLQDEMDAAVKDVAPYLKGGLEAADFSEVKTKLTSIWKDTDAGMRSILDEDSYREYDEEAKSRREVYGKILDEWEDDRLSRR